MSTQAKDEARVMRFVYELEAGFLTFQGNRFLPGGVSICTTKCSLTSRRFARAEASQVLGRSRRVSLVHVRCLSLDSV